LAEEERKRKEAEEAERQRKLKELREKELGERRLNPFNFSII
jgi:hypothetical protein